MKTASGYLGMACIAVALCTPAMAADYKLGDRLPSGASSKSQPAAKGKAAPRELRWEELVPADWDPRSIFKDIDLGMLNDADPRAMAALDKLREVWNNAPANPALNGTRIRIPGFVVPLEYKRDDVAEFLLVPYFGACIHSPPPPSNQIIHVIPATPLKNTRTMDAVWVNGTLEVGAKTTEMGNAAYRIKPERIEPYKPEPRR